MPTVAEQLRTARETQGLRIHDVADQTKIRGDHIRALEEGDYDVFSAPVYIRGFVRTYAGLLKLDVKQVLDSLNKELALSGQAEPSLSPPQQGVVDKAMFHLAKFSRRTAFFAALGVLLIAVGLACYAIWRHYQTRDPLEGLSPGAFQAETSIQTLPLPLPPIH
jgi:cytoskeletal protein RodZ